MIELRLGRIFVARGQKKKGKKVINVPAKKKKKRTKEINQIPEKEFYVALKRSATRCLLLR